MGIFFITPSLDSCCLCGEFGTLTGEHKIKAAAILEEFGESQLYIGNSDASIGGMKLAQSKNSKFLKFAPSICRRCNSCRSQPADRAFDALNSLVQRQVEKGNDLHNVLRDVRYAETNQLLNALRYFAKLLCCQIVSSGGPSPRRLANFAIGRTNNPFIHLRIRYNEFPDALEELVGEEAPQVFADLPYAAHGGLVIYGCNSTAIPNGFHSTLTIGRAQYVFYWRTNACERVQLKFCYPDFARRCQALVAEARDKTISQNKKKQLGLN